MTSARPRFHLAFPVNDIESTRRFYMDVLGCRVGREDRLWIDFDFHGHQISAHVAPNETTPVQANPVDGERVPVRHFGVILPWNDWHALAARLREAQTRFVIEPTIRFKGLPGEQATLFIRDPSGNVLEFKSFREDSQVFARE
ncbi:MAG: hypothetical protein GMKNLPBB_01576 [Myxococcota bacterium]|nr:hypothetical protein [Myxococcota bacterium]